MGDPPRHGDVGKIDDVIAVIVGHELGGEVERGHTRLGHAHHGSATRIELQGYVSASHQHSGTGSSGGGMRHTGAGQDHVGIRHVSIMPAPSASAVQTILPTFSDPLDGTFLFEFTETKSCPSVASLCVQGETS
jgi:hypothetical protein